MPRALNTGTCIQQGDLFYAAGQHRKKLGEVFEKNAGEWTGRVEISKKELSGSKRSMYGLKRTFIKRCIVERINKAEIRPEEQNEFMLVDDRTHFVS